MTKNIIFKWLESVVQTWPWPVQLLIAVLALWAAFWSFVRNTEHGIKRIWDTHRFLKQHFGCGLPTVCSGFVLVSAFAFAGQNTLILAAYSGNTAPFSSFCSLWACIASGYALAGVAAYMTKLRL